MVLFTAMAAVISYNDGLYLIRFAGAGGQVAYLYPLLPDGLILISSVRLYEAAPARPAWAMAGVIIGVGLTLAMNVGAGILHNWMYALADACVPVVFFVALEILRGAVNRGRDDVTGLAVTAAAMPPEPGAEPAEPAAPRPREAILLELTGSGTRQEVADFIGVPKSRVQRWATELPKLLRPGPEEASPDDAEAYWGGALEGVGEPSLNGSAAGA